MTADPCDACAEPADDRPGYVLLGGRRGFLVLCRRCAAQYQCRPAVVLEAVQQQAAREQVAA